MSKQGQGEGSEGRAGADPSKVPERTEQKEMHSKDAHQAREAHKPASPSPKTGDARK